MNKISLVIGILGGIGLGLLIGSEFSGSYITIFGAIFMIISLISMRYLSVKSKIKK
jgi:hypothetical protein